MRNSIEVHTEAGPAIITHPNLVTIGIVGDKEEPRTTVALGILPASDGRNYAAGCWALFWERGGDWSIFADEIREEDGTLSYSAWDITICRAGVAEAIAVNPETETDMQWFEDWAARVEAALAETETALDAAEGDFELGLGG